MSKKTKAICVLSGGLDSSTTLGIALKECDEVIAVHFDYKQRTQEKERECFLKLCEFYKIKYEIINADFIAQIGANSLTDYSLEIKKNAKLNQNHINGKTNDTPNTYVPFRNGIFLSIVAGIAEREKADFIYIGVVWEDSSGYPDCKEEFILAANKFINSGSVNANVKIKAPLLHLKKEQIVQKALELNVPLEYTWSCYERNDFACGKCESCLLRLRGFENAKSKDPIAYL